MEYLKAAKGTGCCYRTSFSRATYQRGCRDSQWTIFCELLQRRYRCRYCSGGQPDEKNSLYERRATLLYYNCEATLIWLSSLPQAHIFLDGRNLQKRAR